MLSNLIIQVDHYIAFKFVLLQGSFICSKSLLSMISPVVTFDFLAYTLKSLLFFSRLKFCHNFSNFHSSSISPRPSILNSTLSESNFLIMPRTSNSLHLYPIPTSDVMFSITRPFEGFSISHHYIWDEQRECISHSVQVVSSVTFSGSLHLSTIISLSFSLSTIW